MSLLSLNILSFPVKGRREAERTDKRSIYSGMGWTGTGTGIRALVLTRFDHQIGTDASKFWGQFAMHCCHNPEEDV